MNMKPVKEENGRTGVTTISCRMARDLSGEVTFETSEGTNHAHAQIWGESITGRRKSEDLRQECAFWS